MAHRNPLHRHRDPPWQKPKEWTLNRPEEAFPPERFQIGIAGEIISEWWAISFRNAGRFGSESAGLIAEKPPIIDNRGHVEVILVDSTPDNCLENIVLPFRANVRIHIIEVMVAIGRAERSRGNFFNCRINRPCRHIPLGGTI